MSSNPPTNAPPPSSYGFIRFASAAVWLVGCVILIGFGLVIIPKWDSTIRNQERMLKNQEDSIKRQEEMLDRLEKLKIERR